jgi:hypothetical protein
MILSEQNPLTLITAGGPILLCPQIADDWGGAMYNHLCNKMGKAEYETDYDFVCSLSGGKSIFYVDNKDYFSFNDFNYCNIYENILVMHTCWDEGVEKIAGDIIENESNFTIIDFSFSEKMLLIDSATVIDEENVNGNNDDVFLIDCSNYSQMSYSIYMKDYVYLCIVKLLE